VTRHLDRDALKLESSSHPSPEDGMCIMEAVAYMAHEPFSDHPSCASPVIAAFLRNWNDSLNDEDRQMLKPYIPKLIGTAGSPEAENRRAWMALDWLARAQAVSWLRLAKLEEHAKAIEGLDEIRDSASAEAATSTLRAASKTDGDYSAKYKAAYAAAKEALDPVVDSALRSTVKELQQSALELLNRMIAVRVEVSV